MNRALLIQSYKPDLSIHGESSSDDVRLMREGLQSLVLTKTADCGHAGTVLRFLALRAARLQGRFVLRGSDRLFSRLPDALRTVLSQLGAEVQLNGSELHISTDGWHLRGDGLWIPGDESSQFASAVLLNAWGLKFPLHFTRTSQKASDAYFQMSLELVRNFGMQVNSAGLEYSIPAGQQPVGCDFTVDCDVSSAFVVAAAAAINGSATIQNFPRHSLQPDIVFVRHFVEMGILFQHDGGTLKVQSSPDMRGLNADLSNSPDLFPCLAVLCAFAKSPSQLSGLGNLAFKESNRFVNTMELLVEMGAICEVVGTGTVRIIPLKQVHQTPIDFDSDHDHRMAMAAALARIGGFNVQIGSPEVVNKSFPGFWQIFAENP